MKNLLISLCVLVAMISCNNKEKKLQVPNSFDATKLMTHKNKMQQLLNKGKVAAIFKIPIEKIEEHIEDKINDEGQYTVLYSWPTGKMKKVADGKFEIEEYQSVSIGFVQKISAQDFEKKLGSNDGIQEQVNQMSKQDNFNKEVGVIEAKYLAAYAKERKVEFLENGTGKAIWETPMNALHVFANGVAFSISTNLGDDEKYAKQKSIEVSNAILNL